MARPRFFHLYFGDNDIVRSKKIMFLVGLLHSLMPKGHTLIELLNYLNNTIDNNNNRIMPLNYELT